MAIFDWSLLFSLSKATVRMNFHQVFCHYEGNCIGYCYWCCYWTNSECVCIDALHALFCHELRRRPSKFSFCSAASLFSVKTPSSGWMASHFNFCCRVIGIEWIECTGAYQINLDSDQQCSVWVWNCHADGVIISFGVVLEQTEWNSCLMTLKSIVFAQSQSVVAIRAACVCIQ